jgi:IS5 family transposase
MRAKPPSPQVELLKTRLDQFVNLNHPLCQLARVIDWSAFDEVFGGLYCEGFGRPGKPTRLLVGLHYLKHTYDLSDELVVEQWVENPYWQYFCGGEYFAHENPLDPSSLTNWRKRVGESGMETLLAETIRAGLATGALRRQSLAKVNVDTTVQEKAISYPTDAKLYHRLREKLVDQAQELGIELRQSYRRKSKRALQWQNRYRHARQVRRAKKELRRLKTYCGRVVRDVERKIAGNELQRQAFSELLTLGHRLLSQKGDDQHKLYSLHAPEVECFAKGKTHKKYEFGSKVSLVTTSRECFVVGMKSFAGTPYDGHTLAAALTQAERLGGFQAKEIYVDRGYRGHNYRGTGLVHIVGQRWKGLSTSLRRWYKRRSGIEAVIGHAKTDGRLGRNYLLGVKGDQINAILSGCGYNLRKLLTVLLFVLFGRRRHNLLSGVA